ncbi:hypothetical protein C8A01DRAFT_50461 [Parachaetomium inaequale]|uniref:Uncharacterized protein n=1 Tax=Parachaetomium inaequale TaxID=2588326 RepID=A0AAN6P9M6_9PEZI|nr:hypothetical protein C8A01DRAFT_50461 [Parachaetomium inaequale]
MGRKRTAEDRRRHAEQNGYIDDETAAAVDDNPVPRYILDYTKERYDVQMELWHEATFQTTRQYFRCFVSGWNIDNPKALIPRDHTDSITNYIKKLDLSTATRQPTYLTLENYMYMEEQLWKNDGHEYVHDAYRVFISAKLKLHVFTPARIGEVSEGSTRAKTGKGLRYKDTAMLVAWKNGEPELRYSLKREFAKGMHDKERQRPTHILYEFLPSQPLIVQPLVFMLAIFLARGAFKNYCTLEQVLNVKPPANRRSWVLEWADHVLDQPVFPEVSADGPTEKIQRATSFSKQVKALSLRAGMEHGVTIHSFRREALIQATSESFP